MVGYDLCRGGWTMVGGCLGHRVMSGLCCVAWKLWTQKYSDIWQLITVLLYKMHCVSQWAPFGGLPSFTGARLARWVVYGCLRRPASLFFKISKIYLIFPTPALLAVSLSPQVLSSLFSAPAPLPARQLVSSFWEAIHSFMMSGVQKGAQLVKSIVVWNSH